jgi:hypothetical protein
VLVSAYVEPPPESNRRPHPYHGTTRNRCANRRLPRSRPTVGAEVIGSLRHSYALSSSLILIVAGASHHPCSEIPNSVDRPQLVIARVHATLVIVAFDVVDQFVNALQHLAAEPAAPAGGGHEAIDGGAAVHAVPGGRAAATPNRKVEEQAHLR